MINKKASPNDSARMNFNASKPARKSRNKARKPEELITP
jgi:hypothetical protein